MLDVDVVAQKKPLASGGTRATSRCFQWILTHIEKCLLRYSENIYAISTCRITRHPIDPFHFNFIFALVQENC